MRITSSQMPIPKGIDLRIPPTCPAVGRGPSRYTVVSRSGSSEAASRNSPREGYDHGSTRDQEPARRDSRTAPRSSAASTSAVDSNEVHAIMGPNGSGKSTLAYALMGHPGLRDHRGRHPPRRRDDPRDGGRRARAARPVPGLPVPARRSGRDRRQLPPLRGQRDAQGAGTAARTTRSRFPSSASS